MKSSNLTCTLILGMTLTSMALAQDNNRAPIKKPSPETIVATVNGIDIKWGQLSQAYEQNLMFVSDKKVTLEKVLNDIINREIGLKKAKDGNLQNDSVVKAKMEDVLYHAQISKDLEKVLQGITVSDNEVKDYYAKFKEYRTAHILFRLRVTPDKEEMDEAMRASLSVYNELKKSPQKWPELANKYSQSSSAPMAGDLGYLPAVKYAPEYYEAIKGKSDGHITSPVRTQFGLHIIKVLGVKDFKDIDQALYKKIIYDQKRDKVLESYFAEGRKGAQIKINKEYLK